MAKLCAAFLLIVGLAACESSPALPPQAQAAGHHKPRPKSAPSHCRRHKLLDRSAQPARWKAALDRLARHHSMGIAVGVKGVLLYDHYARQRRTPASNEKLMLTMALFDRFGPRFRIRTTAMARRISHGIVRGDLWLVGGGDPTLTKTQAHFWGSTFDSPTLDGLAERLERAGVVRVSGGVRGSIGLFSHDFDAPGWQPYVPNNYVQLPTALSLNGNFHVHRHPEKAAARALTNQLRAHHIEVTGEPSTGRAPSVLTRIAAVSSAPLSEIVAYMDQSSNNYYAETLGKLLGAEAYGPPGSIPKGADAIAAWTRRHGVKIVAKDSSGLSYRDRVSPLGLVRLLAASERLPWGPTLRRDLPSPGEGTLAYRLRGLDVHAKTGTLFNSDSALSGWVRGRGDGPWIEFSILDEATPKTVEDKIVGILAHAPLRGPQGGQSQVTTCS